MDIKKETKAIGKQIISLRKHFHKYPELGLLEYETSKKIKEELDKIGVSYIETAETGVIASLGKNGGRVVALRADMDAIKISECTGVSYE